MHDRLIFVVLEWSTLYFNIERVAASDGRHDLVNTPGGNEKRETRFRLNRKSIHYEMLTNDPHNPNPR